MNKKNLIIFLVILAVIFLAFLWLNQAQSPVVPAEEQGSEFDIEEAGQVAQRWILEKAPTYLSGSDNLNLISSENINDYTYSFLFSFDSMTADYGDRSDQMSAQVITPHQTKVVVNNGVVTSAITDETFCELTESFIEEEPEETTDADEPATPKTLTIKNYFIEVREGEENLVTVEREIPFTLQVAQASIEKLLEGPSSIETSAGLNTAINDGVVLQSISIEDGIAYADFNKALGEGIAGSAMIMAIREQITMTLTQFETIDEVVISINGNSEDILQP